MVSCRRRGLHTRRGRSLLPGLVLVSPTGGFLEHQSGYFHSPGAECPGLLPQPAAQPDWRPLRRESGPTDGRLRGGSGGRQHRGRGPRTRAKSRLMPPTRTVPGRAVSRGISASSHACYSVTVLPSSPLTLWERQEGARGLAPCSQSKHKSHVRWVGSESTSELRAPVVSADGSRIPPSGREKRSSHQGEILHTRCLPSGTFSEVCRQAGFAQRVGWDGVGGLLAPEE